MFSSRVLMIKECFYCYQLTFLASVCGHCYSRLSLLMQPSTGRLPGSLISHSYFCSWKQNESTLLNAFIKHQKEPVSHPLMKRLVKDHLHLDQLKNLLSCDALLPVPAKREGHQDHAFRIAQVLSELSGKPLILGFKPMGRTEQKNLRKTERKDIVFECTDVNFANYHSLALVDDVLTTGQTMKAMIAALPSVQKFHVLTLAKRELIDRKVDKC